MLEPGLVLCRIIGLLFLAGCALCALGAAAGRALPPYFPENLTGFSQWMERCT